MAKGPIAKRKMRTNLKKIIKGIAWALVLVCGVLGAVPAVGERDVFPGSAFTFCRVNYSGGGGRGWGRGGGWRTDYPESDLNFSLRLSQLTAIEVERRPDGGFEHAVVRLDDPQVFAYPFLYMLEVGGLALSQPERDGLSAYLRRGGFLMVDDFWGDDEWDNWEYEIGQVLPPDQYPMVDIPADHELFSIVFELEGLPQVPAAGHFDQWKRSGRTYEGSAAQYARYGTQARCKGIFDAEGRLMVVVLHNTDLGDGWEREGENYGYFSEFSAKRAYPMGINIVVYAMTH
jgi:hypothetical protein